MNIDLAGLSKGDVYRLMIQAIVPRPIAWVLSDSGTNEGGGPVWNLAPFSYFNGISSEPPTIMLSIGKKADGSKKDTWRNIEEREHFVVHIASPELAPALTASAASLEHGQSEVDAGALETISFEGSRLPRVVGPKIAFACRRHKIVEIGSGPQGVIFGEVQQMWLDDSICATDSDGRIQVDATRLSPLARLGGNDYAALGETITVARPK